MFGLQMNLGMGSFRSKLKALFAHLFTNKTTTVDGTRYLVNQGEGDNAVMHTGQGAYGNGVDNAIKTGFNMNLLPEGAPQNYTIMLRKEVGFGYYRQVGLHYSDDYRILFGEHPFYTDGIIVAVGKAKLFFKGNNNNIFSGDIVDFAFRIDSENGVFELSNYSTGESYVVGNFTPENRESLDFWLLAKNDNGAIGSPSLGIQSGGYIIPKLLTDSELLSHGNNPEQTLYWDNGVLKSDILDQATIDSMQAGNGFWYPLTENVSAGGYYRNHALSIPTVLMTNLDFENGTTGWLTRLTDGTFSVADNIATIKTNVDSRQDIYQVVDTSAISQLTISGNSTTSSFGNRFRVKVIDVATGTSILNTVANDTGGSKYLFYDLNVSAYNSVEVVFQGDTVGSTYTFNWLRVQDTAESGLTPLVNWTSTTSTNAQQLTTGYQCALVEQDGYGLPINPAVIDVKADSLAGAQSQLLVENGLTLTDNAGTLELYK